MHLGEPVIRLSEFIYGNVIYIEECMINRLVCFNPTYGLITPDTFSLVTPDPLGRVLNDLYLENQGDLLFDDT